MICKYSLIMFVEKNNTIHGLSKYSEIRKQVERKIRLI